jgi:hypothetical protein
MSFQKCPICEGTGNNPYITLGSQLEYPCPTCKGARIIDDTTGIPPTGLQQHSLFEPVEPCESDYQHKWVCDLQKEREANPIDQQAVEEQGRKNAELLKKMAKELKKPNIFQPLEDPCLANHQSLFACEKQAEVQEYIAKEINNWMTPSPESLKNPPTQTPTQTPTQDVSHIHSPRS